MEMGVEFYAVSQPAADQFSDVVAAIMARPLGQREYELRDEQVVRLEQASAEWQNCVEGEIARLRFSALPEKGARGRRLESLGLPPEAGVGDRCAFLYDTRSRALLLQKNRLAITASGLQKYLNAQSDGADKFDFSLLITAEAYRKLTEAPNIRKLEISIAAPRNIGAMLRGRAISPILNARDAMQAPRAQFVFSTTRGSGSLPRQIYNRERCHDGHDACCRMYRAM
jgi:hypothetical protein